MEPLPPEFDAGKDSGKRLWVSFKGDPVCLAALDRQVREIGLEVRSDGRMLTAVAPALAEPDRVLAALAAALDRITAEAGNADGVVLHETRMVPAALPAAGEVIRLGARFRIAAAGKREKAAADVVLLTASSVFGSGLHPSTRLAAQAMDDLARQSPAFPDRVLDLGTGSGLLAIMAARHGAAMVTGIDICLEAVAVARENVAANGLERRVIIAATPLAGLEGGFDLVLANLTASVQLRLADALQARLSPGGELILSGLQGRQQQEFIELWQGRGLRAIAAYAEGCWRALRLRNVNG